MWLNKWHLHCNWKTWNHPWAVESSVTAKLKDAWERAKSLPLGREIQPSSISLHDFSSWKLGRRSFKRSRERARLSGWVKECWCLFVAAAADNSLFNETEQIMLMTEEETQPESERERCLNAMILLTGEIKSAQIKKQPVRERESSFTPDVIQMLPAASKDTRFHSKNVWRCRQWKCVLGKYLLSRTKF